MNSKSTQIFPFFRNSPNSSKTISATANFDNSSCGVPREACILKGIIKDQVVFFIVLYVQKENGSHYEFVCVWNALKRPRDVNTIIEVSRKDYAMRFGYETAIVQFTVLDLFSSGES